MIILLLTLLTVVVTGIVHCCPCADQLHCNPISGFPDKEVFGFMIKDTYWEKYNWSELTTIATFYRYNESETFRLVCHAHANNVRVVPHIGSEILKYHDERSQDEYVQSIVEDVKKHSFDGMNIDLESPVDSDSDDYHLLNTMVQKIFRAFKKSNPNYQVTFDVAWSPDCIDGRCYDYVEIAKWTDYLFVMAYDERSQMFGGPPCYARSNSGYILNYKGISRYLKLGIPRDKLILGLPWYGYDYTCVNVSENDECMIKSVPFRGVECSDAAGSQKDYAGIINELLPLNTSGLLYNRTDESPYFLYETSSGEVHQVWFDNPQSLGAKYRFAKDLSLRGVGFWNTDAAYFNISLDEGKEMWGAVWNFLE